MKFKVIKDTNLKEDLSSMSVEDIMNDGFPRDTAQTLYDVSHRVNLSEPMTGEEFDLFIKKELSL